MTRKLYLETYGCQMNEADSECLAGYLAPHGYERTEVLEEADVILVNTCAVRAHAEERVLGRLQQFAPLKRRHPDLVLGLCGCLAQRLRDQALARVPHLDLVVGPDNYRRLPELIAQAHDKPALAVRLDRRELYADAVPLRTPGVRAWVTIMRGCDKFCTFCIVPYVRGRERSRPAAEVVAEVERAVAEGFREVVLLGQTVNSYRHEEVDFADLLRRVNAVAGLQRIRFASPHPADFTPATLEALATCEKVCPQLHLPLQSASNKVLRDMDRRYTIEEYDALVGQLRAAIPDLALTTDLIAGFPTETEDDHRATVDYLERIRFDAAFMFKYSPREGTRAFQWGDPIPEAEKSARLEEIIAVQERISAEINRNWVGRTVEVLVEGPARRGEGDGQGKTPQFKTAIFPAQDRKPGDLVHVRVETTTAHSLRGQIVA